MSRRRQINERTEIGKSRALIVLVSGSYSYGVFIDLAAPGQTIFSTLPDNRFGFLSGTSMAAPHVSGAAVLALARHPDWSAQDLTRMLLNAVDPIQPNKPIGSGRLNVWKAQQERGSAQ